MFETFAISFKDDRKQPGIGFVEIHRSAIQETNDSVPLHIRRRSPWHRGQPLAMTSHYRFLNDTSEFLHGWKIVLDAIDRRGAKIRDISSLAWETVT
ncbi:hypothetical protein ABIB90_008280 [Bradyrhizobium sp. JR4.1]|uniref:hypothetical protein n=1 Tax=Bradyrhizobium sp. JR4.1 TaxID=3156372 RepID=UPI003397F45D